MDHATTSITIGSAREAEYGLVTGLVDRCIPGLVRSWDQRLRNLKSIHPDPANTSEFLAARDGNGDVVGALILSLGVVTPRGVWGAHAWQHIEAVAVDADHRHSGIAHHLIRYAEQQASRRGFVGLYGKTYKETQDVLDFYETCGFDIVPEGHGFDPFEPKGTQCPFILSADVDEHLVACATSHGSAQGRDWFRVI